MNCKCGKELETLKVDRGTFSTDSSPIAIRCVECKETYYIENLMEIITEKEAEIKDVIQVMFKAMQDCCCDCGFDEDKDVLYCMNLGVPEETEKCCIQDCPLLPTKIKEMNK